MAFLLFRRRRKRKKNANAEAKMTTTGTVTPVAMATVWEFLRGVGVGEEDVSAAAVDVVDVAKGEEGVDAGVAKGV